MPINKENKSTRNIKLFLSCIAGIVSVLFCLFFAGCMAITQTAELITKVSKLSDQIKLNSTLKKQLGPNFSGLSGPPAGKSLVYFYRTDDTSFDLIDIECNNELASSVPFVSAMYSVLEVEPGPINLIVNWGDRGYPFRLGVENKKIGINVHQGKVYFIKVEIIYGGTSSAYLSAQEVDQKTAVAELAGCQMAPWSASALFVRGVMLQVRGRRPKSAIVLFKRCLSIDPKYSRAYVGIADSYGALWNYELAIKNMDIALSMPPDDTNQLAIWYAQKGYICIRARDYDQAIVALKHAVKLAPDNEEYREQLAQAKKRMAAPSGGSSTPVKSIHRTQQ